MQKKQGELADSTNYTVVLDEIESAIEDAAGRTKYGCEVRTCLEHSHERITENLQERGFKVHWEEFVDKKSKRLSRYHVFSMVYKKLLE